MSNPDGQRQRLVAILAADAAGYSRLMSIDASATVDALDAARQVFRAAIESHRGRVIDMAGDSVLAVFEAAIGAVGAALEVQRQLEAAAAALPEGRRMRFRVGVHLGDVIEKADGTVYGDGVNIAARLQALAEPGGITVSDAVRGAVRNRLAVRFDDQGEQQVKNIADPVRVFRARPMAGAATPSAGAGGHALRAAVARLVALRWWIGAVLAFALAAAGSWALLALPWAGGAAQGSPPSLSVAVMPFVAAEAKGKDAVVAEAFGQALTTALGQWRWAKVAAPGHAASGAGQAVDLRRIGRELNVRYIVAGEVRAQGDSLGVTVRLVDAQSATQLWSERFEMAASPTGEQQSRLQGRLARRVVNALYASATERALKQPELATPIDLVLRGNALSCSVPKDASRKREQYDSALQLDPGFVPAIVGRAGTLGCELQNDARTPAEPVLAEMDALTARAIDLDGRDASAWRVRSWALAWRGRWGEALAANETAIALIPWSVGHVTDRGAFLLLTGRQPEAESQVLRAIGMDPPGSAYEFRNLCMARLLMGRYDEAALDCERAGGGDLFAADQLLLAAIYAQRGDTAKAAIARTELLKQQPGIAIGNSFWARISDVPAYRRQLEEHLHAGLRKTGIPER
jgi:adenylate cyclase